jgi:hypothetical protein
MKRISLLPILLLCSHFFADAQNYSGLLNKRLNKIDDVSTLLESGIGSLFGSKIAGDVDSVVVTQDSEKALKVKIWFRNYLNGFFTVSVLSATKQKQTEIIAAGFSQASKTSPVECTLTLSPGVPKGTAIESPYLRIDVAKRENGTGNISVFGLNKKWKNQLDPQNVVISIALQPIGKAAALTSEAKDFIPAKSILFERNVLYNKQPVEMRVKPDRRGGGNNVHPLIHYSLTDLPEDISGTWVNTDANTSGITKLIITGNNTIQGFGRCSPQDCDWGKTGLTMLDANNFRAIFSMSFKTTTLNINYAGGQLTVNDIDSYNDGRGTKTYSYTFRKNLQMVYATSTMYTLKQVAVMTPPAGPVNTTPKGPDKNVQIYLLDDLSADVDFRRPQDISNININVFADKNLNSGMYYILPADYHLRWEAKTEPEKGYEFRILYGAQRPGEGAESNPEAPVRMSATLTAGISSRERNFVKALLKSVRPDFVDIRFLQLREKPQFTFQSTLGAQYNIPQDKITVETSTDLTNDIRVAWQTDADTKEFIQTALTSREGISASVILKPDDEDILDQQIPAIINLADMRTLGKMNLEPIAWRSRNWRNATPYPLKLKYLHVLKKQIGGTKPIIYSWSMNDAVVPSQAQVNLNSSLVPSWLDNDASAVMWIEYGVEDCNDCDQKVMDAVTGGVSGTKSQQIKFTIPPAVFDTLRASYFLITVRSLQVDPKGAVMQELSAVKVTKSADKEFTTGPLFVPAGGTLDFEFKITAASEDGDFYPSAQWTRWTDKEVLLGKTKMKEIFRGIIPGIN